MGLIATYTDIREMFSEHLGYFVNQGHSVSVFEDATVCGPHRNRCVTIWDSWQSHRPDVLVWGVAHRLIQIPLLRP